MSTPELKYTLEPPNSWYMVRALGGVGILCALLIVLTFQATLPTITRKRAEALERAVFHVLPGASSRATYEVTDSGKLQPFEGQPKGQRLVYAGYDDSGRLVGVAIEAQGQGFQDTIRLIYGYSPESQKIIGMQVLESKETPGLGDRILHDPDFLANFQALDVSLKPDGSGLEHPVTTVKNGQKNEPWEIDGITGATISSKAVGAIVETSAERTLPVLVKNLDEIEQSHNEQP